METIFSNATLFHEEGRYGKPPYVRLAIGKFSAFRPDEAILAKMKFGEMRTSRYGKRYQSTICQYKFKFERLSPAGNEIRIFDVVDEAGQRFARRHRTPDYDDGPDEDWEPEPKLSDFYDDLEELELNTRGDGLW